MAQAGRQKKLVWAISSSLPHRFHSAGPGSALGTGSAPGEGLS